MIGQTKEIAPADKRIYALRDVTATVESIPLIVASILSKKLAEGIDGLVLDVKTGKGAFMKSEESALALAQALVRVGTQAGKKVVALLTRMDAPLGRAIGNANETHEAIDVLFGRAPADLTECTMALGAEMLVMGGKAHTPDEARTLLDAAIKSGNAAGVLEKMIEAQHGDPRVVQDPVRFLPKAERCVQVLAPRAGFVTGIDALSLGLAGVAMGAGRTRTDQAVDHAVGIHLHKKPGEAVAAQEPVADLWLRPDQDASGLVERVQGAYTFGDVAPEILPLVVRRTTAAST
jgi:pyrimidine-nucleoside phosphorylase